MIQVKPELDIEVLEERLSRGADLLFDMEQRGDTGQDYQRWLEGYVSLLKQYEELCAA